MQDARLWNAHNTYVPGTAYGEGHRQAVRAPGVRGLPVRDDELSTTSSEAVSWTDEPTPDDVVTRLEAAKTSGNAVVELLQTVVDRANAAFLRGLADYSETLREVEANDYWHLWPGT